MAIFLIVLPRVLFKTQPKVCGGDFLHEKLTMFSCLFSQESPTINVQLCSKIAYVAFKGKKIINLHNFSKCYIILHILQL